MKIKFKKWMTNFSLMIGGLFFSLLILEGLTRLFLPISPGAQKVTLQGKKIRDWLIPGCVYYQVSTEYNAITTITEQGYRAPKIIESPDVVFLGDSFAHLFEHEPQNFYYSYDGHFNALGSLKIAEFLISQDQSNSSN